ncbi:Ketol-acid reductoisomerase (NADP(+)) [Labeo rohita]|uniref:Ketol-acid reductoisomerase (NADP(+)) n=1 Tax=Labeo rohita TaxID=84645 RepID=A0ABQ8LF69_LABRO|nr:Ketol-acid reductoisomerase (NADP(+)) [Labeo rohita]
MWRKPWFQSQGLVLGVGSDRCVPHRLRGGHEWSSCPGSVKWSPSQLAHQLSGDAGHLRDRHVLVCTDNTLITSSSCPWASEYGSRRPVEAGAEARGMDASPQGAPLGLDAMVQTWPRLHLYAFLERESSPSSPYWPGRVWFLDIISLLNGSPWEIPVRRDLLSQAGGTIFHPLVTRFLHGVLRPIEEISDRFLTIKTALLLALTSLKRVGDLHALSVAPSYLEFILVMAKAFLCTRAGEPDQQKLNCMCPVRAKDAYVHRAALWQTLSRWIVDAISTAYESSDLPLPLGVKAHKTRGMAASKALLAGVPMQDICNAAGWSTPLNFLFLRQGFGSLVAWASRSHSVLRSSSSWRKMSQVTYVTLVPRGNEMLHLEPYFRHPSERSLHSPKLTPAPPHVLLCFLVSYVTRP